MASEDLVKILVKTKVTDYLEFRSVQGSYVFNSGKVHKVPATASEALASSLMGMFQKRYFKSFLQYVMEYEPKDPKTHKGYDLEKMTSRQVFTKFGLDETTCQFTGHAICLYLDDEYLDAPALDMVNRAKLYAYSVARYGNSPYIYPKWGLGGLPEGFSRRGAVYGGVFMLNVEDKNPFVEKIHYDDKGRVSGVQVGGQVAPCQAVIADPSYFADTDKVKKVGKIVRCIAILSHPIDNTGKADSCQIIVPAQQVKRKSDMYICVASYLHNVAAEGKYIAVISCNAEKQNLEEELAPALSLLGKIDERFVWTSDLYIPVNDPARDGCYITSSYDATTHFVTSTKEVLAYYELITGDKLDLAAGNEEEEGGEEQQQ